MMADTWALECMTYLTTGMVDAGVADFSVESAICKVYGSETCWRVVNEACRSRPASATWPTTLTRGYCATRG